MLSLRVSSTVPVRPEAPVADGPIVLVLPSRDEAPRIGAVIDRLPAVVLGRPTECLVVDDGSGDATAWIAGERGATVVRHRASAGLGAAVRTGLESAVARGAAVVAFCDADGEYDPVDLERLVAPLLDGTADYVVGSRFAGHIRHMRPWRRAGNLALTRALSFVVRRRLTDAQSGFRALSGAAAAVVDIAHDYNYAQVMTIDLVRRGFLYVEVPITYCSRRSGRSFVRLVPYVSRVVPTVWRQLNDQPVPSELVKVC